VASEFEEIYVVDLGGDVRKNAKLSGTRHNVFGIQTGVAISFLVKAGSKRRSNRISYARRPEADTAEEKLTFLANSRLGNIGLERIEPDRAYNWVNLSRNDWQELLPISSRETKSTTWQSGERAIFKQYSLGIVTNRDEWAYGFSAHDVRAKVSQFAATFNGELKRWKEAGRPADTGSFVDRSIKWTSELEAELTRGRAVSIDDANLVASAYRPFVRKWTYFAKPITHRPYQNFDLFPIGVVDNLSIVTVVEPRVAFSVLATPELPNKDFFMPSAAQHFARFRYTISGERIDNITEWALRQFQQAYGLNGRLDPSRLEKAGTGSHGETEDTAVITNPSSALRAPSPSRGKAGAGGRAVKHQLSKDDIFHYVYAVLHDPLYREKYALNLKREFPRIPFYADFWTWAGWGEKLMALHVGYEGIEPWPLERIDTPDERARAAGLAPKAMLKADKEHGSVRLDSETQLYGFPSEVWEYRLGNRSGVEWILDQYREKTPKDPTIREKFNTYRFADYKEKVVDLIARVTRVSVETVAITEAMRAARR
jgi:predicted helicase